MEGLSRAPKGLPPELRRREGRLARRKAQAPTPDLKAQANTTDPESRITKTRQGYMQGYNGQAAVSEDQIILAGHAAPSDDAENVG